MIEIGRVVGSNDQLDYVVQIHGPGDVAAPPRLADRAFGRFVQIPVGADRLVGIIYTTQLLNPAYGTIGPRLSTERALPVFSPDYLAETATVVGVTVIGTAHHHGKSVEYDQGTPTVAPEVDAVWGGLIAQEMQPILGLNENRLRGTGSQCALAHTFCAVNQQSRWGGAAPGLN